MAPTTMRAGYSGVLIPGSAITGTRQPGPARHLIVAVYVAEPPGRQVLTALRASLGDRRAAADAVRDAFGLCAVAVRRAIDKHRRRKRVRPARCPEDVAGEPPGTGPAALTRVQGGTLPDGDRRNAGDTT